MKRRTFLQGVATATAVGPLLRTARAASNVPAALDEVNSIRDELYESTLGTATAPEITEHSFAPEALAQALSLRPFLPLSYYFARHQAGPDINTHALTLRHVDFESPGRAGLSFRLERVYSSLSGVAVGAKWRMDAALSAYFASLQEILASDAVQSGTEQGIFPMYKGLFRLVANNYFVTKLKEDPFMFDQAATLDQLYSIAVAYPWKWVQGNLMSINADSYITLVDPEHPPAHDPWGPGVLICAVHLSRMRTRIRQVLTTSRQLVSDALASINKRTAGGIPTALGEGWYFTLPFVLPGKPDEGVYGWLVFDGCVRRELQAGDTPVPEMRGVLRRLAQDAAPPVIAGATVEGLRYELQGLERTHYFDAEGRLVYITDQSRSNAIVFKYAQVQSPVGGVSATMLHEIVDGAGHSYLFDYASDTMSLRSVAASYGRTVAYDLQVQQDGSRLLRSVTDSDHTARYDYNSVALFQSDLTGSSVTGYLLSGETNPLGGVTNFYYRVSGLEKHVAGLSRTSVLTIDQTISYAVLSDAPPLSRIARARATREVIMAFPVTAHPSDDTMVTEVVSPDWVDRHTLKMSNGRWTIVRWQTFSLSSNPYFGNPLLDKPTSVLGLTAAPLRDVSYDHTSSGAIRKMTDNLRHVVEVLEYPALEAWREWFQLPAAIDMRTLDGQVLRHIRLTRRTQYPYQLTSVGGDTLPREYRYYDSGADPAGCGRPTSKEELPQTGIGPALVTTFKYDKYANLIAITNANSGEGLGRGDPHRTTYEYLTHNSVAAALLSRVSRDLNGNAVSASVEYDDRARIIRSIDPNGNVTALQYDAHDRAIGIGFPDGGSTIFKYPTSNGPPRMTNMVRSIASGVSVECDLLSDEFGNLVQIYNVTEDVDTKYEYDRADRIVRIRRGTKQWSLTYDGMSRITELVDPRGATTTAHYDDALRSYVLASSPVDAVRVGMEEPGINGMSYTYLDSLGHVIARSTPVKRSESLQPTDMFWRYSWNKAGILTGISHPTGVYESFALDDFGRVRSRKVDSGESTILTEEFLYDALHQLVKYTDRMGATTTCKYDVLDRLAVVSGPLGYSLSISRDNNGNIIRQDDHGCATQYAFDACNRLMSVTDPDGFKSIFKYDFLGRLVASYDALGNKQSWAFDTRNNVVQFSRPDGGTERFEYDSSDRINSSEGARGAITRVEYQCNAAGDVLEARNSRGDLLKTARDSAGRPIAVTGPTGSTTKISYINGNIGSIRLPTGGVWQFEYDEVGRPQRRISPEGRIHIRNHDKLGRLIELRFADGLQCAAAYDGMNRPCRLTNAMGGVVKVVRDSLGRVDTLQEYTWTPWKFTYDGSGRILSIVDPHGATIRVQYNLRKLPAEILDQDGVKTEYTYNGTRNIVAVRISKGGEAYAESYGYDPAGRLTSVTFSDGSHRNYEYDRAGNLIRSVDEEGRKSGSTYGDVFDRPTEIVGYDGKSQTFEYDSLGRVTKVKGRVTAEYTYDLDGLKLIVRAASGRRLVQLYDRDGLLVSEQFLPSTVWPFEDYPSSKFDYDPRGRLARVRDTLGHTTNYSYTSSDQLTRLEVDGQVRGDSLHFNDDLTIGAIESAAGMTTVTYDEAGLPVRVRFPDGQVVRYQYTPRGRIRQLGTSSQVKEFEYYCNGLLKLVREGTSTTLFVRDARMRVVQEITKPKGPDVRAAYFRNGLLKSLQHAKYSRDAFGRLTSLKTAAATLVFQYDGAGRLGGIRTDRGYEQHIGYDVEGRPADIQVNGRKYSAKYDFRGNVERLDVSGGPFDGAHKFGFDSESRLVHMASPVLGSAKYEYDGSGNLVKETPAGSGNIVRTYDAWNRLVAIQEGDAPYSFAYDVRGNLTKITGADSEESLTYDPFGRLTGVASGMVTTHLQYDPSDRIASETMGNTARSVQHFGVFSIGWSSQGADGSSAMFESGGRSPLFALNGHPLIPTWILGNVVVLHNERGEIRGEYIVRPYGDKPLIQGESVPYAFKNYYTLADPRWTWCFSRPYASHLKAFVKPDILFGDVRRPISMNRFRVFSANPSRVDDILGLTDSDSDSLWGVDISVHATISRDGDGTSGGTPGQDNTDTRGGDDAVLRQTALASDQWQAISGVANDDLGAVSSWVNTGGAKPLQTQLQWPGMFSQPSVLTPPVGLLRGPGASPADWADLAREYNFQARSSYHSQTGEWPEEGMSRMMRDPDFREQQHWMGVRQTASAQLSAMGDAAILDPRFQQLWLDAHGVSEFLGNTLPTLGGKFLAAMGMAELGAGLFVSGGRIVSTLVRSGVGALGVPGMFGRFAGESKLLIGPAATIPTNAGAFVDGEAMFLRTTGKAYMVRAGDFGVPGRYGAGILFESEQDARAFAQQLATSGESQIRSSMALPLEYPPKTPTRLGWLTGRSAGVAGNPVKAVSLWQTPANMPYLQGVIARQVEYRTGVEYPGEGLQVVVDWTAHLDLVGEYPVLHP